MRRTAITTLLALTSCAFAPDMDAAMADTYLSTEPITSDPAAEIAKVEAELEAMGFRVIIRTDEEIDRLKGSGVGFLVRRLVLRTLKDGRAITLDGEVWLPEDFRGRPLRDQLRIERHEATHARVYVALGVVAFLVEYGQDAGKFWIEVNGMREEVRALCAMNYSDESIAGYIEKKATKFPGQYGFWPHHRKAVREATREALTLELGACK